MAKWICHPGDNRLTKLVPVFRRRFEVHKDLEKATLRLTAHGVYEAELNGVRVTENRFTPGLTSYYTRIQVQEYDGTVAKWKFCSGPFFRPKGQKKPGICGKLATNLSVFA